MIYKEKLGFIVSLISGAAFATLAIFSKFAYSGGANVPSVLFLRFVGAALIFRIYSGFKKKEAEYSRKTIIALLLMGGLGYGTMSAFFLLAVSRIPASLAGMLLYLYPALVTIVTVLIKQEVLTFKKGTALATTSLGLVMVLGASFKDVDLLGIFFGIGAACVYTVYIVIGSKVLSKLDPFIATRYIMTGSALVYSVFGLATNTLSFAFSWGVWLAIGGIILISTVLGVGSFWMGVQLIGPSRTSIVSSVEPLITVVMAWLLFDERLTALQLFGGLLIIMGVIVLQYRQEQGESQGQHYKEY
jgi:drug/metabolite transporter (DMT)-like permease